MTRLGRPMIAAAFVLIAGAGRAAAQTNCDRFNANQK
jgi:hypothetical protein